MRCSEGERTGLRVGSRSGSLKPDPRQEAHCDPSKNDARIKPALNSALDFGIERSTFSNLNDSESSSALLIVGHGSTVNPDLERTDRSRTLQEIRRRTVFAEVECASGKRNRVCVTRFFVL